MNEPEQKDKGKQGYAAVNLDFDRSRPETARPAPASERALEELTLEGLKKQCDTLRHLLILALVVLLIFSGSVNLVLVRQMGSARKDLERARPQVERLVAQHEQQAPALQGFITNLVAFGRSYPDFNQILARHGLAPREAPATFAPLDQE